MMVGPERYGLGDIKSTLTVHDDSAFSRRYIGKRFVFVSSFDPDYKVEVFIVGADGACIAFPMAKRDRWAAVEMGVVSRPKIFFDTNVLTYAANGTIPGAPHVRESVALPETVVRQIKF